MMRAKSTLDWSQSNNLSCFLFHFIAHACANALLLRRIANWPISGIDDEDGVELASNLSSRKNARNMFIPTSRQYALSQS